MLVVDLPKDVITRSPARSVFDLIEVSELLQALLDASRDSDRSFRRQAPLGRLNMLEKNPLEPVSDGSCFLGDVVLFTRIAHEIKELHVHAREVEDELASLIVHASQRSSLNFDPVARTIGLAETAMVAWPEPSRTVANVGWGSGIP